MSEPRFLLLFRVCHPPPPLGEGHLQGRWTQRAFNHLLPELGAEGWGAIFGSIRTGRKESPRFIFLVGKMEERKLVCTELATCDLGYAGLDALRERICCPTLPIRRVKPERSMTRGGTNGKLGLELWSAGSKAE